MTPQYCYTVVGSYRCLVHTRSHLIERFVCRQMRRGRHGEEGREEQERGSREEAERKKSGAGRVSEEGERGSFNKVKHSKTQVYVPTQILWSLPSWNPVRESHVHWKEPAVLTQLPRGSQPSIPIAHSSMSKRKEKTISSLT